MRNRRISIRTSIVALLVTFSLSASGQADRNIIYKVSVDNIGYTPKEKKESLTSVLTTIGKAAVTGQISEQQDQYADAVRAGIVKGIGNVRRFRTIEGGFNPGEIADNEGAFYVDGTIANITTTAKTEIPEDKKQKPYDVFKAQISVTLNLKDVHTDEVFTSKTFDTAEYDYAWIKTAEGAINKALSLMSQRITDFFDQAFPLHASIVERGEAPKNKEKEVFIDLGTEMGVYKGQHFEVLLIRTIAGREAQKEIGRLKVTEVLGENISQCKVTRGGKDIKQALDSQANVVVRSEE